MPITISIGLIRRQVTKGKFGGQTDMLDTGGRTILYDPLVRNRDSTLRESTPWLETMSCLMYTITHGTEGIMAESGPRA